jgi:hypothetical protein
VKQVNLDQSGLYFLSDLTATVQAASVIDDIPLPFQDRMIFSKAPVNVDSSHQLEAFRTFTIQFASPQQLVSIDSFLPTGDSVPNNARGIEEVGVYVNWRSNYLSGHQSASV